MGPESRSSGEDLHQQLEALKLEADEETAAAKRARPEVKAWYEDLPRDEFVSMLIDRMTEDQATTIKRWRTTHTWRAVAAECHEKYLSCWGIGWTMPDHQDVGALVCEAAARRLDEDPGDEAWNG